MQILGKRSKVLLIAVAIIMLAAIGISFATWDVSAVKATSGELSSYANAKVGDIIEFGKYYQTGKRINNDENAEYEKTPIEWIVVDKDERTGQLTLMSKYILACGSYFGNYYDDGSGYGWHYNNKSTLELGGVPYNQAYIDSTARAFLNNLERLDMGGDTFNAESGYIPSGINSTKDSTTNGVFTQGTGLLSSVGFSNQRYWTNLKTSSGGNITSILNNPESGLIKKEDNGSTEVYYKRPINNNEFKNRPVARGLFDESFSNEQKSMIVPKVISGYIGHRWPDSEQSVATKSYIEGVVDKIWLPSVTELNIASGFDWNGNIDSWTNPSDETGSTVFEYFKNYKDYGFNSVAEAIKTNRTPLASNGNAGNYSIPIYDKGTTTTKIAINSDTNTTDQYWTRSASSHWYGYIRTVHSSGIFYANNTYNSSIGIRPCMILKY